MSGVLLWLVACEGGLGDRGGPGGDTRMPAVVVTSPADGEGRYGSAVEVSFEVENFTLDADGDPTDDAVGHVHALVDGAQVAEIDETSYTFEGLASGEHVLGFQLVRNDETELGAVATVNVRTLDPTLAITSPNDGAELTASAIPVTVGLTDFTVSPSTAMGDAVFGEGRIDVLLDGVLFDVAVAGDAFEISSLPEGTHEIELVLAHADGTPVDPPVRDSVSVVVPEGLPSVAIDRAPYLEVYDSATAHLSITATNAELAYHVYLDGVFATRGAEPELALRHLAPGYHLVEVRLVDGSSELPIRDHAHLFVAADRPDLTITYPSDQWGVPDAFDLSANPENFVLNPDIGGANVDGEGHWAVVLDGAAIAESATGTASLSGLPLGDQVLRVELRNNDRTPLEPPVYDEIQVTVE